MAEKYRNRLLQSSGVSSKKFESEYAKRLLLKMGWKEGAGLGLKQEGVVNPVQIRRKDDNKGLGHHRRSEWQDTWWNDSFNTAIGKLKVGSRREQDSSQDSSQHIPKHKTPRILNKRKRRESKEDSSDDSR